MPRSELRATPQHPARFKTWLETYRGRFGLKVGAFHDLMRHARDKENARRQRRSPGVRWRTVIDEIRAVERVAASAGKPPAQRPWLPFGLLAAGLYIDYAVIVGQALEGDVEPRTRLIAMDLATMHGAELYSASGVAVPSVDRFLENELGPRFGGWRAAADDLESAFEAWYRKRRWQYVPAAVIPAVACFHVGKDDLGLHLLRAAGLEAMSVWTERLRSNAREGANAGSSSVDDATAEAALAATLAWSAEVLRLPPDDLRGPLAALPGVPPARRPRRRTARASDQ
jgi:hypothetical protein